MFWGAKFVTMNTPQKFQECRFRLHHESVLLRNFRPRFIRRISAMSTTIKKIDNEMICFCNNYLLFELYSTRQKCDV